MSCGVNAPGRASCSKPWRRARQSPARTARSGSQGSWKKNMYQDRAICWRGRLQRLDHPARMRNVQDRQALDLLGVGHRGRPRPRRRPSRARPGDARKRRARGSGRGCRRPGGAGAYDETLGRLGGQVVAAHVGGDDAEAGGGEGRDLMAPAVPELREAVEQDDERARRRVPPRRSAGRTSAGRHNRAQAIRNGVIVGRTNRMSAVTLGLVEPRRSRTRRLTRARSTATSPRAGSRASSATVKAARRRRVGRRFRSSGTRSR